MKTFPSLITAGALLLVVAGCSTVDSRISKHEAAFSQWPPAVQQQVRAGQVGVGFTQEQVEVALGEPSRTFTRTNPDGTTQVWVYPDKGPHFSFGVGVGSVRGNTGVGLGVGVSDRDWRDGEKMRVIFDRRGVVEAIETAKR